MRDVVRAILPCSAIVPVNDSISGMVSTAMSRGLEVSFRARFGWVMLDVWEVKGVLRKCEYAVMQPELAVLTLVAFNSKAMERSACLCVVRGDVARCCGQR